MYPANDWELMKQKIDIKFWVGIGISLFFLILLFRKIDLNQMLAALRTLDYGYVALAVLFTFINYFFRAVRWRYLLISEKSIPLSSLYPATIIGYMANNLLPARLGEFIRAYLLAQKEGLEAPSVFASLVIDRLCDGCTVMVILLVTMFTMRFPQGMEEVATSVRMGGVVMGIVYCGVIIFLIVLKRQTARTLSFVGVLLRPFPAGVKERVIPLLGSFIGGIRLSLRGTHVATVIATSGMIWFFCIMPVDFTMRSFGIDLPITASMFIMILLVFAVMVPASPGYIGTYHYACVKGLSVFGIAESKSVSIALIIHAVGFFPVIVAGFYHLWKNKISLSSVRKAGSV